MNRNLPILAFAVSVSLSAQWGNAASVYNDRRLPPQGELQTQALPRSVVSNLELQSGGRYVLSDKHWHTWGASVIHDEDGKYYHLFYSRWPKSATFTGWLTHSEIAHAVAESPDGPYRYIETVLQNRGPSRWDAVTAHNPKIKKFNGRYYLYYIATENNNYSEQALLDTAQTGYSHPNWWPLRNLQRTGVAVADSLAGPWLRSTKPIVEPAGPITTITVNPAITQGPKQHYFLIIKGDKPNTEEFIRNQALATALSPTGPFTIYQNPVINSFDSEDMSIWYDAGYQRFNAVFHAHTYVGIISSSDGYRWLQDDVELLLEKGIPLVDGSNWMPERMERPFVLTDRSGRPTHLFVGVKRGEKTANVVLPIDKSGF